MYSFLPEAVSALERGCCLERRDNYFGFGSRFLPQPHTKVPSSRNDRSRGSLKVYSAVSQRFAAITPALTANGSAAHRVPVSQIANAITHAMAVQKPKQ